MTESIIPAETTYFDRKNSGWLDAAARRGAFKLLSRLKEGKIILKDSSGIYRFGETTTGFPLQSTITVRHPRFYRKVLTGGSIGAGESYMAGYWSTDNLTRVIRIILRNQIVLKDMEGGWARLTAPIYNLYHYFHRNSRKGSRNNITAHYDLGNDFYNLFLDNTWTYSSGIFESDDSSLEDASIAKYERLCRKLALSPEDHVLEIGSGWGGFAIHVAQNYGCRVTTATISDAQYALAKQRIQEAGLTGRVKILKKDYRDLTGKYDKLVSIEMIEAVGHQYYDIFFKTCSDLLKPDGIMAIQAITIGDHVFDRHKYSADFIKRYIFPGSCIPSITAMHRSVAKVSDLRLFHLEDITPHYARTLRMWRERFFEKIDRVKALGYGDMFIRMWDFYLSYCEAGFAERYIGNVQMVFTNPLCRRDPILPEL
jgi:cyclopropane-fatty-acyl-phospholipid synthase